MEHTHHESHVGVWGFFLTVPFLIAISLYVIAVILTQRRYRKPWPTYRSVFWILGILCAGFSVIGPLADLAKLNFKAHMVTHLLLGMLSPLLLVLATPMTLLLRTLEVKQARVVSRILKSRPLRIFSDPLMATILNIGGLWLLYMTDLYSMMHQYLLVHILVHVHVFLAGYLFTMSIVSLDLTPHRTSYKYRSIVLLLALAGHAILSKILYITPPDGVSSEEAEVGSMMMYYGGDAVEVFLVIILCYQWFKATKPRSLSIQGQRLS